MFADLAKKFSHKGKRRNPYQTQILVRDENFDQKYVSKKNIFIFSFCIYFPSIHTTSFSSQLHPPRWLEQNFYFPHLNHLLRKPIENPLKSNIFPFFQDFLFFEIFFQFRKTKHFFRKNIFLTPNSPRNPKIILRKPCDEPKHTKNDQRRFFSRKLNRTMLT